jgi:hypothetical protein
VHSDGRVSDEGSNGGPLWRLLYAWPRAFYRWNEHRYEASVSYAALQAVNLGVLLGAWAVSGAVGVLGALLRGRTAAVCFWVGVSVAAAASMLALVYLLWGGLLERLAKRR